MHFKNKSFPHTFEKDFAQIQRVFQNCFQPLLPKNDSIDNSNTDNNNDDSNRDNNNNIIYDINNKVIHRKPKRKTNWLQEWLKENTRTCGCYSLNQQRQDEHT